MTNYILRQGLVHSASGEEIADVLIVDGKIAAVAKKIDAPSGTVEIDAKDCWVGPGFVDIHTHLREPGREEAETIESGALAALMGGYTAIVAMPNTEPALDNVALVSYVLDKGARTPIDVAVAGAITQGRKGELLAPMAEMAELGVRLFTDDGTGVQSPSLMRRALSYAKPLGITLAQHCEDEDLAGGGSMNEGEYSAKLGLIGRPALAEELMLLRDLELVKLTGAKMHFLHMSTQNSVALISAAKKAGLPVTFEIAPHHFTLDESACSDFDALFKVHPPLRTKTDVAALRDALRDGSVDAVATDHAPHAPELKDLAFDEAPAGMLGLEHAASLTVDAVGDGNSGRFFEVMSRGPARIAQLRHSDARVRHSGQGGDLVVGEDANLVVFDPSAKYVVDRDKLHSRSTNTPYHGRKLRGKARVTIAKGRAFNEQGEIA